MLLPGWLEMESSWRFLFVAAAAARSASYIAPWLTVNEARDRDRDRDWDEALDLEVFFVFLAGFLATPEALGSATAVEASGLTAPPSVESSSLASRACFNGPALGDS